MRVEGQCCLERSTVESAVNGIASGGQVQQPTLGGELYHVRSTAIRGVLNTQSVTGDTEKVINICGFSLKIVLAKVSAIYYVKTTSSLFWKIL
jgi:hypothetical protein